MGSENIDVRRAEVNFEVEDTPAYLLRNVLRGDTSISIAYHYHRHDIHRRLHGVELLPSTVLVGGGFDPHSAETKPTDVVDVITISSAA